MIVHRVTLVMLMGILACQLYLAEEAGTFVLWECYNLWPLVFVSLPILLACHPRIDAESNASSISKVQQRQRECYPLAMAQQYTSPTHQATPTTPALMRSLRAFIQQTLAISQATPTTIHLVENALLSLTRNKETLLQFSDTTLKSFDRQNTL